MGAGGSKLGQINMEKIPGVLMYKISEWTDLKSIILMETLSPTIRYKLRTNLSGF